MTDLRLRESALTNFVRFFDATMKTPADIEHAFALVREVAFRKLGEKPFPVQITGALALEHGYHSRDGNR